MRTTLTIDDDVLAEAKERARHTGRTAGQVLSDLARQALTASSAAAGTEQPVHGWVAFPRRGGIVTNDLVNALREEEGV